MRDDPFNVKKANKISLYISLLQTIHENSEIKKLINNKTSNGKVILSYAQDMIHIKQSYTL